MAKQIIILDSQLDPLMASLNCAFWFIISTGPKTQVNGSVWSGASATENNAIQQGVVIEEVRSFQFPNGLDATSIKNFLLRYWTLRNAQVSGLGPDVFLGVFEDSITGWSI